MALLDIRTGKEMTRGGFLKGILAAGIAPSIVGLAGSANGGVGRGMMRGVGARNAAVFGGRLPYDEEVEYLESHGTEYIDTGVIVEDDTFGYNIRHGLFGGDKVMCGVYFNTSSRTWTNLSADYYIRRFKTAERYGYSFGRTEYMSFPVLSQNGYMKSGTVSVTYANGKERSKNILTDDVITQTNLSFYLFACNKDNAPFLQSSVKIYGAKISQGNSIVRNLIPVRVGNEGCLYDIDNPNGGPNSDGLYHNLGNGNFGFPGRL